MAENDENIKSETALREERILEFWKANKVFEKSLKQTEGKKEFIFFEGPPTANGKPGIHHLIARAFKDAIPRYKTMQGYHVRRKGGWDTHGLPVELQVEKKLGLNSKKAIEEYGIAKFNQECKESVWEYLDVWEKFTDRIGFWIDQDNPYVTYRNDYIESVWNIIKKTDEQKLLYKDYKVIPWCPRCGTALSSHELAQGYEDVKDLSITAKFKIVNQENTFILAWTTTPWTLPGNIALAVGKNIDYVKVKIGNEFYILAEERLSILTEEYEIVEELKGEDLIGFKYEPLFPFLKEQLEQKNEVTEKAWQVYPADFVNTEDGTGVVHTSVMYGQDDFELGIKFGLPKLHLVNQEGHFMPGTGFLAGLFVKDEKTDVEIIKDLAHRGLLYKKEKYEHSYPHCWRCHTALIYYARDSWYIKMSDPKVKQELIEQNKHINWEPSHIRDGRFGEWLREIKDWAISRERYWGTPLPIWECKKCNERRVIESINELKDRVKKSGNRYFLMRHGESESNINDIINSDPSNIYHLTEKGKQQALAGAENLKNKKIDLIISSHFPRCRETAEITRKSLGLSETSLIIDERLGEFKKGPNFEGEKWIEYWKLFKNTKERFEKSPDGGENLLDLNKRMGDFIYDIEQKYSGKNILFVSHEGPIIALQMVARGSSVEESIKLKEREQEFFECRYATPISVSFVSLPHNENYELDLHRPYIDAVELVCDCGGSLTRTKEVMDVWLDSGTMPFSQDHYPFENKNWVDGIGYPADYICEAIDQTRGWFYTLHATGVLMGKGRAFQNVICLGHILDKDGKKMSKSLGNVVDPWVMIEKYGVDTLRLWMYSVNQPGESKNFDEKTVALLHGQVFTLLYNVLAFYELYRDTSLEPRAYNPKLNSILDQWIIARLNELIELTTYNLNNYKLLEPTRAFRDFIGDLSTWYLRRSRERIKDGDVEAKQTLYYVLKTLAKLMAPFAPFTAEDIWQKLKTENDKESVHLESWPTVDRNIISRFFKKEEKIINNMKSTRVIVTLGLEARQKAGIKVRQPLTKIEIKDYHLDEKYSTLIRDELNIKEAIENRNIENEVLLDIKITPELKEEGDYRELARGLQDMRKKMGLTPSDIVSLSVQTNDVGHNLILKFEADMKKTVLVSGISFQNNDGIEILVDDLVFKVKIDKI
ncbi:isoleucine--tRNA ligase [Candidatus Nomurabacteria bacterium CG10_big_fil_rev_8_21_14_0_10_35_16]|uniref:Isoleucine--tRNA ligase n=1 Tax=Candidatus Nomurabacteria bacterium CG10_big_fil_rev_8_21_14_0_10_35_16 TaxID=1974731 RepID=A0A2H0TDP7_9BACT|nr:MAG: isoleucine--tRNA ligase [Candidatus Nomurabacteria bacterium CG10_big_fil_rev_8_21_14_0_10_35_16]